MVRRNWKDANHKGQFSRTVKARILLHLMRARRSQGRDGHGRRLSDACRGIGDGHGRISQMGVSVCSFACMRCRTCSSFVSPSVWLWSGGQIPAPNPPMPFQNKAVLQVVDSSKLRDVRFSLSQTIKQEHARIHDSRLARDANRIHADNTEAMQQLEILNYIYFSRKTCSTTTSTCSEMDYFSGGNLVIFQKL